MAHPFKQEQVVLAVGVKEAVIQVCARSRRQALGRIDFALAKAGRADDGAGELTLIDLKAGAQNVRYTQVLRRRFHLVGRGRRNNGDGVTLRQVCIDEGARLRVDQARNFGLVQFPADGVVGRLVDATHELRTDCHHAGKPDTPQPKVGHG